MEAEKKRNARQIMSYAKRYGHILQTGDASELLQLNPAVRRHVMEAIVYFSKYAGAYDTWKAIKDRYGIKWSIQNDIAIFQSITDDSNSIDSMLNWVMEARSKVSSQYGDVIVYGMLTGLRPTEVCQSIHLLRTELDKYVDATKGLLMHYKYPEFFIRNTKKAYVSILTDDLAELGRHKGPQVTYGALRHVLNRAGIPMHMAFTRKIFGTYLKQNKIDTEIIDLFQADFPGPCFCGIIIDLHLDKKSRK